MVGKGICGFLFLVVFAFFVGFFLGGGFLGGGGYCFVRWVCSRGGG